jgi:hypothetical protein
LIAQTKDGDAPAQVEEVVRFGGRGGAHLFFFWVVSKGAFYTSFFLDRLEHMSLSSGSFGATVSFLFLDSTMLPLLGVSCLSVRVSSHDHALGVHHLKCFHVNNTHRPNASHAIVTRLLSLASLSICPSQPLEQHPHTAHTLPHAEHAHSHHHDHAHQKAERAPSLRALSKAGSRLSARGKMLR